MVRYSPAWFGPNANPVPKFTDATIPSLTTFQLSADYYFGYGDNTKDIALAVEIPIVAKCASLKTWMCLLEAYHTTPAISKHRGMLYGNTVGTARGDIYIQTRIRITKEKEIIPSIIFNSTFKTATGTNFLQRRYFDTPGYYLDIELGKSFFTTNPFFNEIRLVGNFGFMSWETVNSAQNDAPLYGIKIIVGNSRWKFENTLSGYSGWMHTHPTFRADYDDAPLVYTTKILRNYTNINYFLEYQYGIRDFPYRQIKCGITFSISKLTPKWK